MKLAAQKLWKILQGILFGSSKCSTNAWLWAATDRRYRRRKLNGCRSFTCCQRHPDPSRIFDYLITSTPSEPIVAEAAAQVLLKENMISTLCGHVTSGLIEKVNEVNSLLDFSLRLPMMRNNECRTTELSRADRAPLHYTYSSPHLPFCAFA